MVIVVRQLLVRMSSKISSTFLYFAFGSNLLTRRIHLNNPSAQKIGIGKLKGYKLDFNYYSNRWKGATATIVQCEGSHVYGILWRISLEDKKNLDEQEEIHEGVYHPIEVVVEDENGLFVKARTYQLVKMEGIDKRPSFIYRSVIIEGAKENGLPQEYIEALEMIEHNGYKGDVDVIISQNSPSAS